MFGYDSGYLLDAVLDSGWLPHAIIRMGARRQTANRIAEIASPDTATFFAKKMAFVEELKTMSIAIETDAANKQHYETPVGLLTEAMGPRLKYSSSLFPKGNETLPEAEEAMLDDYVKKAGIEDGMSILDLGSGWGSASLYLAERFPNSRVVGISNSKVQKGFVEGRAREMRIQNLEVIAGNVVDYEFESEAFDRAVSIEMFEHMKNYELLLAKVARALKPGGKLFVHVFAHKDTPYHFEDGWMTRYFFTGGTMPSADLFLYFQKDLKLEKQWWISGTHYQKSLEAWLKRFVANKKKIWPVLIDGYGEENAKAWYNRWQCFFIGCAEFFGYDGGNVFGVAHFLFVKPYKV